jgi:hypothetical protein
LDLGWKVEDTGNLESFDLRCVKDTEELRVEVKGTSGRGASIQLTVNEVTHAQSNLTRVDLFVVSEIEVLRSPDGPIAIGGRQRVIENWSPSDSDLLPDRYVYKIPQKA